jgi:hypothetical protein
MKMLDPNFSMEVFERKLHKYMMIILKVVDAYGWMAALAAPSTVEERRLARVLASLTVE